MRRRKLGNLCHTVMVSTYGEQIFRRICFSDTPLLTPVTRSVSAWWGVCQRSGLQAGAARTLCVAAGAAVLPTRI